MLVMLDRSMTEPVPNSLVVPRSILSRPSNSFVVLELPLIMV